MNADEALALYPCWVCGGRAARTRLTRSAHCDCVGCSNHERFDYLGWNLRCLEEKRKRGKFLANVLAPSLVMEWLSAEQAAALATSLVGKVVGPPKACAQFSARALVERGMVGLYDPKIRRGV